MFLTPDELSDLTGRMRFSAQARVLKLLGIEHRVRPDGSLVVLRAHVESVLGGVLLTARTKKKTEPNWAMMT